MLTARGQVVDKVLGLKLGADDYLTKPFDMLELLARIEVQLRRARRRPASTGDASTSSATSRVDFRKAEVTRARPAARALGARVPAAQVLHRAPRATLTRDELLNEVWGYHSMPSTRTVDVHVAWLRQKIEPNPRHPQYILTVHGMGYKFVG